MVNIILPLLTCHANLRSAVFQAGGLVVVLVEVNRKPYLASIVPVIVNTILNEHQIIVDIVAFVNKGDFPRSRLGEKQRGKILAGWVTRKLRSLAQFSIRDLDAEAMENAGVDNTEAHRMSTGSGRSIGLPPATSSSLRNVEPAPQILEQEELDHQMDRMADITPAAQRAMAHGQALDYGHDGPQEMMIGTAIGGSEQVSPTTSPPPSGPGYQQPAQSFGGGYGQQGNHTPGHGSGDGQGTPQIRLPSVDGRENMWLEKREGDNEEDWTADAIMHMNLAGAMDKPR
jgi:hypothetical protein